jgi:hypothetical protein
MQKYFKNFSKIVVANIDFMGIRVWLILTIVTCATQALARVDYRKPIYGWQAAVCSVSVSEPSRELAGLDRRSRSRSNAPEYSTNVPAVISGTAALLGLGAIAASGIYSIPILLLVGAGLGLIATVAGAMGLGRKTRNRLMAVAGMIVGMVLLTAGTVGWILDHTNSIFF